MIKELTEDPSKKFRNKTDHDLVVQVHKYAGIIQYEIDGHGLSFELDDRWEEIKEPVDFMTALNSCKKVRIKHELIDRAFVREFAKKLGMKYTNMTSVINKLSEVFTTEELSDIIQNGKWYIEEE